MYNEYDYLYLKKECKNIRKIRIQKEHIILDNSFKCCCWKLGRGYKSD